MSVFVCVCMCMCVCVCVCVCKISSFVEVNTRYAIGHAAHSRSLQTTIVCLCWFCCSCDHLTHCTSQIWQCLMHFSATKHLGHAFAWRAGYLSAICHDLDHKGVNNDFLIKTSHPLAIQYNDLSPLENHHVSQTFRLLQRDDCGLLRHLSKDKLVGCCPEHVACIWLCGLPTYWCCAAAYNFLSAQRAHCACIITLCLVLTWYVIMFEKMHNVSHHCICTPVATQTNHCLLGSIFRYHSCSRSWQSVHV